MFKSYSSSSRLVITTRWFATSRLVAPVSVRLVFCFALSRTVPFGADRSCLPVNHLRTVRLFTIHHMLMRYRYYSIMSMQFVLGCGNRRSHFPYGVEVCWWIISLWNGTRSSWMIGSLFSMRKDFSYASYLPVSVENWEKMFLKLGVWSSIVVPNSVGYTN